MAEEIIFNRISTGAQNDLERITKMAYAMVVDYGMSEKVGLVSFNLSGSSDNPVFQKPYSDETARVIDEEVRDIIEGVRHAARVLLEEKRGKLEEMAKALLEKEVLGAVELLDILGPRPFGGDYVDVVAIEKQTREADAESAGDGVQSDEDPSLNGASTEEEIVPDSKG